MTEYITCPEISKLDNVKHGFFTRKGGVSKGLYDSLNLGAGSKDNKSNIEENRRIILGNLGVSKLYTLYQVHSNKVITLTENDEFDKINIDADALVTNVPNIAIGILTADCAPVLFVDYDNKIIGAAHAGRKGAVGGIIENTLEAMLDLGAQRQSIIATIGPCISQDSYEVGMALYEHIADYNAYNVNFFTPSSQSGHFMFDLPGYVRSLLIQTCIKQVNHINKDTYTEEELFYSYRRSCHRNEPDYGRQISAICLK